MELREIEYVLAIAKYKNITHAAESLYITQPSLSRFLQKFESDLGFKIFDRIGHKFMLTYAGERYIDTAQKMIALRNKLQQELQDIVENKKGRLRVAFSRIRGSHVLPNVMPIFMNEYPHVELKIFEAQSTEIEKLLENGEVDIAIMNKPINSPHVESFDILEDHLLLATPMNHSLSAYRVKMEGMPYDWIDLGLFKDEQFLLTDPSQKTRELANEILSKKIPQPHVLLTTQNIETTVKLVAKSIGVCFIPESFTKFIYTEKKPDYFLIGDPPVTSNLVVAYRKNAYISEPAMFFIETYKQIVQKRFE